MNERSETVASATEMQPSTSHGARLILLAVICVATLAPFAGKAYHIDDTLFLKLAQQIQQHPLDFFGFQVNWHFTPKPMAQETRNPPLWGYALAAAASVLGFGEVGLDCFAIVPAIFAIWGTYRLAERCTGRPMFAAIATLFMPAFLVSSTSVMCDTAMLALWMWSLVLWLEGLDAGSKSKLVCSGVLIGLCAVTKYFGISLVPLLLVYTAAQQRRISLTLAALFIPIIIFAAYQALTYALYGQNLLYEALSFARGVQAKSGAVVSLWWRLFVGLSFLGGSTLALLFFAPFLLKTRGLVYWAASIGIVGWLIHLAYPSTEIYRSIDTERTREIVLGHQAVFATIGLGVIALACADWWRRRDSISLLLWLWVVGVYLFTAAINWTANVRSILPAVPAVAILITRELDRVGPRMTRFKIWVPVVATGIIALAVAYADEKLADSSRAGAQKALALFPPQFGRAWFEGHWGFQYYMEQAGATAVDANNTDDIRVGDYVVIPMQNADVRDLLADQFQELSYIEVEACGWCATEDRRVGAGFYASGEGPVPFIFARVPPQDFKVYLRISEPATRTGGGGREFRAAVRGACQARSAAVISIQAASSATSTCFSTTKAMMAAIGPKLQHQAVTSNEKKVVESTHSRARIFDSP
jgi:hypothetical protein